MTHDGPWLSRKDWRRLVELHASGRITRSELERLKLRLTRVRNRTPSAPRSPGLRLLQGGRGPGRPGGLPPLDPDPRQAA